MYRGFIKFIIVLTFIFSISGFIYSQNNSESDTVIINNITIKTDAGELPAEVVDIKDAAKWANNLQLILMSDDPPVIDNKAFFITQYQTFIPVTGYKKDLLYNLYIDFLRYEQKIAQNNIPSNIKLKIFIRDIYGNKRQIGTVDSRNLTNKKIFEVSIPFDLSYPGKFDIIIHEYSGNTGKWGIWDIIVTSKKLNEIEVLPIEMTEKMKEIESKIFK